MSVSKCLALTNECLRKTPLWRGFAFMDTQCILYGATCSFGAFFFVLLVGLRRFKSYKVHQVYKVHKVKKKVGKNAIRSCQTLYKLYNFQLDNSFVVSNYSRRLHSHKTLVLELAADGYNLTQSLIF